MVELTSIKVVNDKSKASTIPGDRLLRDYSRKVAGVRSQYDEDSGRYDHDGDSLVMPAGKRADIPAVFDADVDRWLRALTGDRYPQVEKWVALAVSKPLNGHLPALVRAGEGRVGKDSVRKALAQFWGAHNEGTHFHDATDTSNNNGIELSPVVVVEEELKTNFSNRAEGPFGTFKRAVTDSKRRYNAKWHNITEIYGYWRVVCTLNDVESLMRGASKNPENIGAAMNRIFYVPIINSPELQASRRPVGLVDDGLSVKATADEKTTHWGRVYLRIAKHFAHLHSQHAAQLPSLRNELMRFVHSDDALRRRLVGDSAQTQIAWQEVLVRLQAPASETAGAFLVVDRQNGRRDVVLIGNKFGQYFEQTHRWDPKQSQAALRSVTVNQEGSAIHDAGRFGKKRGYRLDLPSFLEYCLNEHNIENEEINRLLSRHL